MCGHGASQQPLQRILDSGHLGQHIVIRLKASLLESLGVTRAVHDGVGENSLGEGSHGNSHGTGHDTTRDHGERHGASGLTGRVVY
jgi:hypothetical protein